MQPPSVPRLFFKRPNPRSSSLATLFQDHSHAKDSCTSGTKQTAFPRLRSGSPKRAARHERSLSPGYGSSGAALVPERPWYQSTVNSMYKPCHALSYTDAEEPAGPVYASAELEPQQRVRLERAIRQLAGREQPRAECEALCDALAVVPRPLRSRSAGAPSRLLCMDRGI